MGLVGHGADVRLGGGADDAQGLEGEPAQESVLAPGGVEEFGDGAADGAGGEPGSVLGAGRVGPQLGAAAEHVLGALLDVPGGALCGDADLLQLDPDGPAAERGERGLAVGAGECAHGGEGVQGPVEERGQRGVLGRVLHGLQLRAVGDFAALGAQFGDALFEQVEELRDRDGSCGQLEEGEDLRHRGDDLGDGGGLTPVGAGVADGPGVEEGDPAAQYGAVVAVPGAQPPAGARDAAVHLDESRETCGVPVRAGLSRGQGQVRGRPLGGRVGERALALGAAVVVAVGSRAVAGPAGAQGGVGPAGDAGRAGEYGARHAGEFRGRRCALRRAGCGSARGPLGHRSGGGGQGSRADESEPGVARDTGRHGGSLPVDGPKTQTECHAGRQRWPTHRVPRRSWGANGQLVQG
jgi:hypothetical protein